MTGGVTRTSLPCIAAGVCAFSMALVVTQRAVDCRPHVIDPALTALWPQDRSSGLQGPALPDMDFRNRASSNFSPNIVSETGSTGFVEDLVRPQADATGDDFLLDLGGAAEDRLDAFEPRAHNRGGEQQTGVPVGQGRLIRSARFAVFARCDLSGDHVPEIVSPRGNSWSAARPRRQTAPNQRPRMWGRRGLFMATGPYSLGHVWR